TCRTRPRPGPRHRPPTSRPIASRRRSPPAAPRPRPRPPRAASRRATWSIRPARRTASGGKSTTRTATAAGSPRPRSAPAKACSGGRPEPSPRPEVEPYQLNLGSSPMAHEPQDRVTAERRLWDEIQRHQIGMLGIVGAAPHHSQPMTAFAEPSENRLWFFTHNDTELVREIAAGGTAMFVTQGKGLHACIGGELSLQPDRERMDKYWNAVVAAWHPQGKDDPRLTM